MKRYLIIILLFVSVLSFGQETKIELETPAEKDSKIKLSPFFSYDFNSSPNQVIENDVTILFNYEEFNFKTGIDIEFKITNRISISSGINFSSKNFTFNTICPVCDPLEEDILTVFQFLELPLVGIYTYEFNEFEIFGQLGIINQVNVDFGFFDENFPPDNLNRYNVSGKIGLGISYPIINKHRLFIATDYTSSITSLFENIDYKLKTVGIRMGVQFQL